MEDKFTFRFPNQSLVNVYHLYRACHLSCSSIRSKLVTLIMCGEYKSRSSSLCTFLQSSSFRDSNAWFNTLCSTFPNLCYSLSMCVQVSRLFKEGEHCYMHSRTNKCTLVIMYYYSPTCFGHFLWLSSGCCRIII